MRQKRIRKNISPLILAIVIITIFIFAFLIILVNSQFNIMDFSSKKIDSKNSVLYAKTIDERPESADYILQLKEKPLLSKKSSKENLEGQKKKILDEQDFVTKEIKKLLNKDVKIKKNYLNVFNGLALEGLSKEDIKNIEQSSLVEKIYPDLIVSASLTESVLLIKVSDVWALGYTGQGKKIAIIDTGIDYTHADLGGCFGAGCKVEQGWDFVNNDNDPIDDNGHGTHVAGIAAGNGALKGVAYDSKIYAYKVLGADGKGTSTNIIAAIERAVDPNNDRDFTDHVDVISMSLGADCAGYTPDICGPNDPRSQAVDNAVNTNVVVVVSAGNLGPGERTIKSPGTARKAITIGSTDKFDNLASSSSRGPTSIGTFKPDVTAPGVSICSAKSSSSSGTTCFDASHILMSGTSMAAPHVAGAATLLLQKNPSWTPNQIKYALRNTALDLGLKPQEQGYGRIDVLSAIGLNNAPLIPVLETAGAVSGVIDILGTLSSENFQSYKLEYKSLINMAGAWNLIAESTNFPSGNLLYSGLNTASIDDGEYILRLTLSNSLGQSSIDRTYIKINNFEDTVSPTAIITSPLDGVLVPGTLTVTADASDNVRVTKVEFYRYATLFGTDYEAPYEAILSLACGAGQCNQPLTVKAYDADGNIGVSPVVTVTLDSVPPTVQLNLPADGSVIDGSKYAAANSFDDGGVGVERVEFYKDNDNTPFGVDYQGESGLYNYLFDTRTISNGIHTFYAISYDKVGNKKTSNINTVTISNILDNESPVTSITSPVNNRNIAGTLTISATASDNIGVTRVEFYKDSDTTPFATDTISPYSTSLDTKILSDGVHTIKTKAHDAAGNVGTSLAININVDNTIPITSITSPANGGTVQRGKKTTISATASDVGSGVNRAEFYVNNVLKCTDTSSPYSCVWAVPSTRNARYDLQTKAHDNVGLSGSSSIVTVTTR